MRHSRDQILGYRRDTPQRMGRDGKLKSHFHSNSGSFQRSNQVQAEPELLMDDQTHTKSSSPSQNLHSSLHSRSTSPYFSLNGGTESEPIMLVLPQVVEITL